MLEIRCFYKNYSWHGFDFYWNKILKHNALARGSELKEGEKHHVVTTFESFEHFINPEEEIEKIFELSDSIVFNGNDTHPLPKIEEWWYYGTEHGQHVAIYSKKSLRILAENKGRYYYNLDNLHFFSREKINFWKSAT